jgi:hypothetical protein
MGGFADDKNTESVIIVFFPPFLPANFWKKKSDKIIRSESADRCGLDIITF